MPSAARSRLSFPVGLQPLGDDAPSDTGSHSPIGQQHHSPILGNGAGAKQGVGKVAITKPVSTVEPTGSRTLTSLEREKEEARKLLDEVMTRPGHAHGHGSVSVSATAPAVVSPAAAGPSTSTPTPGTLVKTPCLCCSGCDGGVPLSLSTPRCFCARNCLNDNTMCLWLCFSPGCFCRCATATAVVVVSWCGQ